MISVAQALDHLFALAQPLGTESVPLQQASGRVLRQSVTADRDQPPFPASAMDGYAVTSAELGQTLTIIGESAAGHGFSGTVAAGQAVRIFTGAPVPTGAARVVIQEDTTRDGDTIRISSDPGDGRHIRPAGTDFKAGFEFSAPKVLNANDIALLAAMNCGTVNVAKKPKVALISTGDELVMPGETPGPDQIIVSNTLGLAAMLTSIGAEPRILPIAKDTESSLKTVLSLISDADLVITIGGASVGDHDLVAKTAQEMGLERAFHKVAMRPGKPLMSGRLGDAMMIGLPGNPVSAMVCGHVFVAPVIRAMLGLPAEPAQTAQAVLVGSLSENGPREHYMRAHIDGDKLTVFERQDSSLLSVLHTANALIKRAPNDPAITDGAEVTYLKI